MPWPSSHPGLGLSKTEGKPVLVAAHPCSDTLDLQSRDDQKLGPVQSLKESDGDHDHWDVVETATAPPVLPRSDPGYMTMSLEEELSHQDEETLRHQEEIILPQIPFALGTRLSEIKTYTPHESYARFSPRRLGLSTNLTLRPVRIPAQTTLDLSLEQFCEYVEEDSSSGDADIGRLTTYKLRSNGVPHRFAILECTRSRSRDGDGVDDDDVFYVRIDRRPNWEAGRREFVLELGHAKAADSAVIGRTKEIVLGGTKPKEESRITFPSGERMTLRQLGVYLRVIVDAMKTYGLFSENCWLLASLVQEYVSQYSGKHRTFDFGGLSYSWLAVQRRDKLRETLRYAHHLPPTPVSTTATLRALQNQISPNSIHWSLRLGMKTFSFLNSWKSGRHPDWAKELMEPLSDALDRAETYDRARIQGPPNRELTESLAKSLDIVRMRLFSKGVPQDVLAVSAKLLPVYESLDRENALSNFFYLTSDAGAFESGDGSLDYIWGARQIWKELEGKVQYHEIADLFAHVCSLRSGDARAHRQAAVHLHFMVDRRRFETRDKLDSAGYLAGTALHLARIAQNIMPDDMETLEVVCKCLDEYARLSTLMGQHDDACIAGRENIELRYRICLGDRKLFRGDFGTDFIQTTKALRQYLLTAGRVEEACNVSQFLVSMCEERHWAAVKEAEALAGEGGQSMKWALQDTYNTCEPIEDACTLHAQVLEQLRRSGEARDAIGFVQVWTAKAKVAQAAWLFSVLL